MKESLKLHEFFIEGSDRNASHVLLQIREPETPSENAKGVFFALVEINDGEIGQIQKIQEIISQVEKEYYDTESELTIEKRFEFSLEKANKLSHHILSEDNSVHAIIGIIREKEVLISYHGSVSALVFYQKEGNYKHIDILEEPNESETQLFSSIIEGSIGKKDILYVATPHTKKYIQTDNIIELFNAKDLEESAEAFQYNLEKLECQYSFGGILFQREESSDINFHKEDGKLEKKKNILPPIEREEKNASVSRGQIKTNYRPRKVKFTPNEGFLGNLLINLGRAISKLLVFLFLIIKFIFVGIFRFFVVLFIFITNKGNQRQIIIDRVKNSIKHKKDIFKEMSIISKIVLAVSIVLLISFVTVTSYYQMEKREQAEIKRIDDTYAAIVNKVDAAEAKLLYNDEKEALNLFIEAQQLATKLPDEFNQDGDTKASISEALDARVLELQKIEETPMDVLAEVKGKSIAKIGDTILAFGEKETLYKINSLTGSVEEQKHESIKDLKLSVTPKEQDKVLFLSGTEGVAKFEKENQSLTQQDIAFPNDDVNLSSLFVYNTRLYTLDTANNQIYKHNRTLTGFDRGKAWLKTEQNISTAVSLAIDGDLYLLFSNGTVKKYTGGNKENFALANLDLPLESPTQIWTYNGVDEIFILEPRNKRVVIFDKSGALIKQITSSNLKEPSSMAVDSDAKVIYLLDDGKIYKVKY